MINYKLIINKFLKQFINAIIAGMIISIACVMYLCCSAMNYKILGGFIFGLGFLFIGLYGYEYYSQKIGYVVENKVIYILDCLIAFIGNFAGTWLIVLIVKMTSLADAGTGLITIGLESVLSSRVGNGLVLDFIGKSLISGLIIYLTFNTYKKAEQPIARFLSLFIGAFVISLLGFDELVSDMFYFNMACFYDYNYGELFAKLMYVLVGNSLGAMIIPLLRKLKGVLKS